LLFLVATVFSPAAQIGPEPPRGGCPDSPVDWDKKLSRLKRVSTVELEARAIRRVKAEIPSSMRVQACVAVETVVSPDGKVMCARAAGGHVLLRVAAQKAAMQWLFIPAAYGAQPVVGHLLFSFNSSSDADLCAAKRRIGH
jgi:hypothetical protein